jgi:uncharacterized protein YjbJ (UPF0337 family)
VNKDQVSGRVEEAKGKVKQAAGKVTGSTRMKAEGLADQAAGKVQKNFGDAKEHLKDGLKKDPDAV